jgi:hypothetical protein
MNKPDKTALDTAADIASSPLDTSPAPAPTPAPKRRRLTLPLFSLAHKPTMHIVVTGKFREVAMPKLSRNEDGMVTILPCVDVETGEEGLLLAYTVVQSAIERSGDDYVGHRYTIERGAQAPGKDYYQVEVYELDAPA